VTRLEGIDGRPLSTQQSACEGEGGCSFTDEDDGFIYAFLTKSAVHAIQRHTLVGHLASQRAAEKAQPVRQSIAPLGYVMRWNLDPHRVEVLAGVQSTTAARSSTGSQWGYSVSPGNGSSFNFSVEVHSLALESDTATTATSLTLSVGAGDNATEWPSVEVQVPRMRAVNASWLVDLTPHADESGEVMLRVTAAKVSQKDGGKGGEGQLALPLVIRLLVGHWDCLSDGAKNSKNDCSNGKCTAPLCSKQHYDPDASSNRLKNDDTITTTGTTITPQDFGARADGKANDTAAIHSATAACAKQGGCTLIFGGGVFLTGPFTLPSNSLVIIEAGSKILAAPRSWWDGWISTGPRVTGMLSLMSAAVARNLTLTGGGVIDGQGAGWWRNKTARQTPGKIACNRRCVYDFLKLQSWNLPGRSSSHAVGANAADSQSREPAFLSTPPCTGVHCVYI
jgi:hypothetical protein